MLQKFKDYMTTPHPVVMTIIGAIIGGGGTLLYFLVLRHH